MIETALIMGLVALVAIVSLSNLGKSLHNPEVAYPIKVVSGVSLGAPAVDAAGNSMGLLDRVNGALVRVFDLLAGGSDSGSEESGGGGQGGGGCTLGEKSSSPATAAGDWLLLATPFAWFGLRRPRRLAKALA